MNDLPDPSGNNPINTNNPISQSGAINAVSQGLTLPASGAGGKELEPVGGDIGPEVLPVKDLGAPEIELPKEVVSAGVKVQPTTIQIPAKVQQYGLKPAGQQIPLGSGATVTLPLTDDQIAMGLTKGIIYSWRWLAEWCARKIKQLRENKRISK